MLNGSRFFVSGYTRTGKKKYGVYYAFSNSEAIDLFLQDYPEYQHRTYAKMLGEKKINYGL